MARSVDGIVKKHRGGFGFLIVGDKGAADIYLPAEELVGILDGDRLRVEVFRSRGQLAGRLVEVLARGRRWLIGRYRSGRRGDWVEPLDEAVPAVTLEVRPAPRPKVGERVKVRLTGPPTLGAALTGVVVERLGNVADPLHDVLGIAYARGFAESFPTEVLTDADKIPTEVQVGDIAGRRDLRSLPLCTIDGADARDFDDAIYCERLSGGGYRLVVAIADVAHYVRASSALDTEALARSTSVYFPNLVLPMLPERLSNGICSLKPEVERLCVVADLTLDAHAKVQNTELYEAVMKSHARLTYEEVAVMMGEAQGKVRAAHRRWQRDTLPAATELSRKLTRHRMARGAIDFDLPEPRVVLGPNHLPTAIVARTRLGSHRLIEEFMLAANEAVAWFFASHGLPTLYRVHDDPDAERLEAFLKLARAYGLALPKGSGASARAIGDLLERMEGRRERHALNFLLLRSMQQAVYQPENIGHYGLAASHYLHFTSPIRRYPDLIVQRLLKQHWARAGRAPAAKERAAQQEELGRIGQEASERERAAMAAEREVDAYFGAFFMKPRIGETFNATITGVTDFGVFVRLSEHHVEGLVRFESLAGTVRYDEQHHCLSLSSGKMLRLGDSLRVICVSVSVSRRQISFEPVGALSARERPREKARGTSQGRSQVRSPAKSQGKSRSKPQRNFAAKSQQRGPRRGGATAGKGRKGARGKRR